MKRLLRFGIAGTLGFGVDVAVLLVLTQGFGLGPYAARLASFLAAATATWWINRNFTFATSKPPSRAEWVGYVGLMVLGGVVNYGVYAACIAHWDLARSQLWLPVALGSIAGLGVNFTTSRALIFKPDALS